MVTADPFRTPTFTLFADPDWFFFATGATNLRDAGRLCVDSRADEPELRLEPRRHPGRNRRRPGPAYVGPGVKNMGDTGSVWTDHTDHRPTMLTLLGLKDDYQTDGRTVTEIANENALPVSLRTHHPSLEKLGAAYKQLMASFGSFSMDTLIASTHALASNSPGDATYTGIEGQIEALTSQRNALAADIRTGFNQAEFNNVKLSENQLKDWIRRPRTTCSLRQRRSPHRPELIHFGGLELAPRAGLEPFEGQPRVAAAVEPHDRVADRRAHALDLMLAALVQHELDPSRAESAGPRGSRRPVVELDAASEPLESLVGRVALDLGDVDLLDLVARVRKRVRELAVVGEQERAGRVCVEPADRDDAGGVVDEVDDGSPPLWVARGRDHARRLVQEDVGERLQLDGAAVELDPVALRHEGVQLTRPAVDGDAARLDQLVGAAPRGDPGAGEVGVQAHSGDCFVESASRVLRAKRRTNLTPRKMHSIFRS